MKRISILIYIICVASVFMAGATHRALVIGLGEYEDKNWGKIHGDNDIYYVTQLLMSAGYTDIITLKNEAATKQGILNAFAALTKRCRKGDKVYVHYSGHGQLMTDLDGDEILRLTGRHAQWDESWVPYDAYMHYGDKDHGEKHLCDDEVEQLMSAIREKIGRKGELRVVTDACHSGDSTCGEEDECVRGVDIKFSIPLDEKHREPQMKEVQWLSISACKPYQLCTELKDFQIGKLTHALYSIGTRLFEMSNEELQQKLQEYMDMNKGRLPQDPEVAGRQ